MGDLNKFVERIRYYCDQADLGYDQSNRWDIREHGECDCSSLVYWCLWEAGFLDKPSGNLYDYTLYTGTIRKDLVNAGWRVVAPNGSPQVGDVLLNDGHHVAVCTAPGQMSYASIDENGNARGGRSGDQTDRETRTVNGFSYSRGWDCYLRYGGATTNKPVTGTSFPLPRSHWYGKLDMNEDRNHSGWYNSLDRPAIRAIQEVVGARIDGLFGDETKSKVRVWQRNHDLDDDGEVGILTWNEMFRS